MIAKAAEHTANSMAKFTITFLPLERAIEVDPAEFPYGRHGAPGSILDIALANDIMIEHACGGIGACATCHVIVREGMGNVSEATT